jgi:hypothetical protein
MSLCRRARDVGIEVVVWMARMKMVDSSGIDGLIAMVG